MRLFGNGISECQQAIRDLDERVAAVERQAADVAQIRAWRDRRREFWLVKVVPSLSAVVIAVLGLNTAFRWF